MKLRKRQVEAAAEVLGDAVRSRQRAEEQRERAERVLTQADAEADRRRAAEREALERGALRAGDLHRAEAWEAGVVRERAQLATAVEGARTTEAKAGEAEDGARGDLAAHRADADVVEKDAARFDERERKRALAKEEETAEERSGHTHAKR